MELTTKASSATNSAQTRIYSIADLTFDIDSLDTPKLRAAVDALQTALIAHRTGRKKGIPGALRAEIQGMFDVAMYTDKKKLEELRAILPQFAVDFLTANARPESDSKDRHEGHGGRRNRINFGAIVANYFRHDLVAIVNALENSIESALKSIDSPKERAALTTLLVPGRAAIANLKIDPGAFFAVKDGWYAETYRGLNSLNPSLSGNYIDGVMCLSAEAKTQRCKIWAATVTFARAVCATIYETSKESLLASTAYEMLPIEAHRRLHVEARNLLKGVGNDEVEKALRTPARNPRDLPPTLGIRGTALRDYLNSNIKILNLADKEAITALTRVFVFLISEELLTRSHAAESDGLLRERDRRIAPDRRPRR
jgi:hypothetical protein